MAQFVFSVEELEITDPGADGAMGTANPVKITPIREESVVFTLNEPAATDIKAEDKPGVVVSLPTEGDAPTLTFESLDVSNNTMMTFFGGTVTSGKYSFPANGIAFRNASIKLTTKPLNGKKAIFTFPLTQLLPSGNLQYKKNDVASLKMTAKILTPIGVGGAALSMWQKEEVTV